MLNNNSNNQTVIQLFEERVAKTPDQTAIVSKENKITYSELNKKSNQFANYLRKACCLNLDDLIGVNLPRTEQFLITILGILKSGAAYVPIDISYPKERVNFIVKDSNCKIVIDHKYLKKIKTRLETFSTNNLGQKITSSSLAYVIYTSGTSGRPKGVMIEHKSLLNLCHWHKNAYNLNLDSRSTLLASISFDASVWEIFPYLTFGGCLYPLQNKERIDMNFLVNFINKNKISHIFLPTVLLENFSDYTKNLIRKIKVLVGGENLVKTFHTKNIELYNNYGPTENTVVSSFYKVGSSELGKIPIGKPISNTTFYILDESNELCPSNTIGELCISGNQVARGYLNNPDLTESKFIKNSIDKDSTNLMYKTGDLAKVDKFGQFEFYGRKDDQIKFNGYRIELQEIENRLKQLNEVVNAVVTIRNIKKRKSIEAYIVLNPNKSICRIKEKLKKELPSYMIPNKFIELNNIPVTTNGKINRKEIFENNTRLDFNQSEIHSTKKEQLILCVLKKTLEIDNISLADNFFDIGGDSILAVRLVTDLEAHYYNLKIQDIYDSATLKQLIIKIKPHELKEFDRVSMLIKKFSEKDLPFSKSNIELQIEDYQVKCNKYIKRKILNTENQYQHILLLGCTGFLGIHLLYDLLKNSTSKLTIIVRPNSKKRNVIDRLNYLFKHFFNREFPISLNKISVIEGALTESNFGLNDNEYENLLNSVDAVINAAAIVKHYGDVKKFERVNIDVVKSIICFIQQQLNKADIHHISTLSIVGYKKNTDKHIFTEFDLDVGQFLDNNIYAATKLKAEKILDSYRKQGYNINIYRIGNLSFHSNTGIFQINPTDNAFFRLLKAYVSLGMIPKFETAYDVICIDWASTTLLKLINQKDITNTTFHIKNQFTLSSKEIVLIANRSKLNLKLVDPKEFLRKIKLLQQKQKEKENIENILLHEESFKIIENSEFKILTSMSDKILQDLSLKNNFNKKTCIPNGFKKAFEIYFENTEVKNTI